MNKRKKVASKFPEVREAQRTQPSVLCVVLPRSQSQVCREVMRVQLSHARDTLENREDVTEKSWTIDAQGAHPFWFCFFAAHPPMHFIGYRRNEVSGCFLAA